MASHPLTTMQLDALLDQNTPVIIGLSGGVDSMVLFDVLKRQGYTLIAAHINHQKRPEADEEAAFLKTYVEEHGMPIKTMRCTFETDAAFQSDARNVRLDFFKACAQQYKTNQIVLAHHQDDLIETFFMRIVKGSPLFNLISMSPRHVMDGYVFVRPFLSIAKHVLYDYAKTENIPYFEDASNRSDMYTRNRFRHQMMPWLREENPAIGDAVAAHTEALSQMYDLVDTLSNRFLEHEDPCAVSVEAFAALNRLVAEAVLKKMIKQTSHTALTLSKALLQRLLDTLKPNQGNLTIPLDKTLTLYLEYDTFFVSDRSAPAAWTIKVDGWGRYHCPDGRTYVFSDHKLAHMHGKYAEICYNCTVFPLYLRTRRPGDTMRCDYGHKKVSRMLIDEKVPPSMRDRIVLLSDEQAVLWIPFLNKTCHCDHAANHQKIHIYEVEAC